MPGLLRPGRYTQGLQPRGQWLVAQIGLVILEGTCNLIAKLRLVKELFQGPHDPPEINRSADRPAPNIRA